VVVLHKYPLVREILQEGAPYLAIPTPVKFEGRYIGVA
jgi:hypothetical protein